MSFVRRLAMTSVCCLYGTLFCGQEPAPPVLRTCDGIKLETLPTNIPLRVRSSRFLTYADNSISSVTVENRSGKGIASALILVDYLLGDRHLLTAIYRGETHTGDPPLRSLKGRPVQSLAEPVAPNSNFILSFASDIVPQYCPGRGNVSKVSLEFVDGTHFESSLPGWKTDPVILEAQSIDMKTFPSTLPADFLAMIRVDENGHGVVVGIEHADDEIKHWFQLQLDKWTFIPGDIGPGVSGENVVSLLVRLHGSAKDDASRKQEAWNRALSEMVVDVVPPQRQNGKFFVFVGGTLASQHALADPEETEP